jgi:2'-5' RNA ligase
MRVFVALELPGALLDALEAVQGDLPGRHVPRENLHLTLAFLGEQGEGVLRELHEALSDLVLAAPEVRVTGLDVMGGRRPNLCFAAVAPNGALDAAHRAVVRACREAGVDLRRERFRPHVTLARFGREMSPREEAQLAQALGVLALPAATAAGVSLMRSDLRPEGPVYSVLAQYDFGSV